MQKAAYKILEYTRVEASQIINRFNPQTVERGFEYFKLSKISGMTIKVVSGEQDTDIILVLLAKCSGTHGRTYQSTTEINVREGDLSPAKVVSDCSCPVGYDCKHGVALLFEFLANIPLRYRDLLYLDKNQHEEKSKTAISSWLDSIKNIENDRQSKHQIASQKTVISANFQVVYILSYENSDDTSSFSKLVVEVKKVRRLKKGGFGRATYCDIEKIQQMHYDLNCSELDVDIATSLRAFEEPAKQYYYNRLNIRPMELKGELGAFVLEQMLRSDHCYWQDVENPFLVLKAEKELKLSWIEQNGKLHAQAGFDNADAPHILFKLSNFYYLNLEQQCFHRIVHPQIPIDHLHYLLSAPPIPKSEATIVSTQLLSLFPNTQMPLPDPKLMEITRIENQTPIKILKLRGVYFSKTINKPELVHCASLSFDYAGQELNLFDLKDLERKEKVIRSNGQRFLVERDLDFEKKALGDLKALGLKQLDSENTYFGIGDLDFFGETRREKAILWQEFKTQLVPQLVKQNWLVSIEDSYQLSVENVDKWYADVDKNDTTSWFEMSLGFDYQGQRANLLPILIDLLKKNESSEQLIERVSSTETLLVEIKEHHWVNFPTKRIVVLLKTLVELYDQDAVTFDDRLTFSEYAALHYSDLLNEPDIVWRGAADLLETSKKLQGFKEIQKVPVPENLQATLRDYQKDGLAWLQFLREYRFDGILADDMGLGKTIQAIANILYEKNSGRALMPTLVIAPTSLLGNWFEELRKFAPSLKTLILQGSDRKNNFSKMADYDVILTTYPLILRDSLVYLKQSFHYLILDEAQAIKNPKSKSTRAIFSIKSSHRLCLTGTPIENHLGELWSMFNFLMPGYLGAPRTFKKLFRTPIEKDQDALRSEQLRKRVAPFMLRRTKDLVAKELPEKTEMIRQVILSGGQRDLYETVRMAMDKKVRDEIKKKGLNRSQIVILDALLKLRQVCCDPRLVKLDRAKDVKESAKLDVLMEMLADMLLNDRKILIFSQFTSMLTLIEDALKKQKIKYTKLTGRTKNRTAAIEEFQNGEVPIFLISLKAGGVGLNLTAADTVIHYDPWWNPAVERQATDRAHRIGQDKPVFVYKLIVENTVEKKIVLMQQKKQELADAMYGDNDQKTETFAKADLLELLQPMQ